MSDNRQLSEAEIKLLISERIDKEFTDVSYAFVEKLAGRLSMFIQPKLEDRCKKCPNAATCTMQKSHLTALMTTTCLEMLSAFFHAYVADKISKMPTENSSHSGSCRECYIECI